MSAVVLKTGTKPNGRAGTMMLTGYMTLPTGVELVWGCSCEDKTEPMLWDEVEEAEDFIERTYADFLPPDDTYGAFEHIVAVPWFQTTQNKVE